MIPLPSLQQQKSVPQFAFSESSLSIVPHHGSAAGVGTGPIESQRRRETSQTISLEIEDIESTVSPLGTRASQIMIVSPHKMSIIENEANMGLATGHGLVVGEREEVKEQGLVRVKRGKAKTEKPGLIARYYSLLGSLFSLDLELWRDDEQDEDDYADRIEKERNEKDIDESTQSCAFLALKLISVQMLMDIPSILVNIGFCILVIIMRIRGWHEYMLFLVFFILSPVVYFSSAFIAFRMLFKECITPRIKFSMLMIMGISPLLIGRWANNTVGSVYTKDNTLLIMGGLAFLLWPFVLIILKKKVKSGEKATETEYPAKLLEDMTPISTPFSVLLSIASLVPMVILFGIVLEEDYNRNSGDNKGGGDNGDGENSNHPWYSGILDESGAYIRFIAFPAITVLHRFLLKSLYSHLPPHYANVRYIMVTIFSIPMVLLNRILLVGLISSISKSRGDANSIGYTVLFGFITGFTEFFTRASYNNRHCIYSRMKQTFGLAAPPMGNEEQPSGFFNSILGKRYIPPDHVRRRQAETVWTDQRNEFRLLLVGTYISTTTLNIYDKIYKDNLTSFDDHDIYEILTKGIENPMILFVVSFIVDLSSLFVEVYSLKLPMKFYLYDTHKTIISQILMTFSWIPIFTFISLVYASRIQYKSSEPTP